MIDYTPAFETGAYSPSTVVNDQPIGNGPKNAGGGYRGSLHLREAVQRSINTIAWQVLEKITPLNEKVVAEGTDEKVKEVEDALADGSLHVFDTSTFTVDGKELTTYKKDGSDTEYVSDGYFHESEYGSAPAFDVAIDGITSITE